jgi:uncharacterized caspase-like protein
MAKRALVVGSQTGGLEGPLVDTARMARLLEELGFEVDRRVDAEAASRAGILEGYRELIDRCQPGDAAMVYYSGHGVRVLPSADPAAAAAWRGPRPIQAIVPMDFDESTEGDFRGITDLELSALLAQLTARTANAAVILDCCHAAAMSKDVSARPRARFQPSHVDFARHVERAVAGGLPVELLAEAGNPHAVRLVAAGQSQSAYERPVGGVVVGTFTESLLLALRDAAGRRVTWEAIGQRVRERVLDIHPGQRADIEGPRRRYVFETEEAPRTGAVAIVRGERPGHAVLRAGRVHGVHEGDEYAVLPGGADADVTRRIAIATVTRVDVGEATAEIELVAPHAALGEGAQAVPLRSAAPRRMVRLDAEGPARDAIAKAIEATGRLTIAGSDAAAPSVLATVRLRGEQLELLRPAGDDVVPAMKLSDENIARLAVNLRMLAAAQGLRELGAEGGTLPGSALEVTWGRVEAGEPVELAPAGEVLAVGTRIFIRVRNTHPQRRRLYVSIFDIGLAQRIQLLTSAWPGGAEIAPGEAFVLGQAADGTLRGLELGWSKELPADEVRTETLVVIATEEPCDLAALETSGVKPDWSTLGAQAGRGTELQQLATQIQHGTRKDVVLDGSDASYLVRQIAFELSPWPVRPPGAGSGTRFLIDDRPPGSVRIFAPRAAGLAPRGAAVPPRKLALRITDAVVHDTRAWLGSSDIRLDTLVTTRLPRGGARPYRAETLRFQGIRDHEALPLGNALVYYGDARDFLDFRVWVSRDLDESKALAELLDEQLNAPDLQEATTALLTAASVSSASTIVAAVGAAASLTAIAWRLLSAALPKSIGFYQTSLLAGEGAGFGQGCHPRRGLFRAQGFSFGYEVVAIE